MNNLKKRLIAIAAVSCMALTSVAGCSSSSNSSSSGGGNKSSNSSKSDDSGDDEEDTDEEEDSKDEDDKDKDEESTKGGSDDEKNSSDDEKDSSDDEKSSSDDEKSSSGDDAKSTTASPVDPQNPLADIDIDVVTNEEGNVLGVPFYVSGDDGAPAESGISSGDNVDPNAPDVVVDPNKDPSKEDTTNGGSEEKETETNEDGEPVTKAVQKVTEVVAVTEESGEPVTEIVTVTEESGEAATDEEGEPVTTAVPVTKVVEVEVDPEDEETSDTEGATDKTEDKSDEKTDASEYVSNTEKRYLLWIDISEDVDYFFEDQFVKLTFKVKDDAPDRDYTITMDPDLSNKSGKSVHYNATVLPGTIRVGGDIDPQDVSDLDGLVLYADNISAKQGDTVEYYLNIKNNPGIVAVLLWFSYDSNALEFVSCQPAGEFAEIAKSTSQGTKPAEQ